MVNVNIYYRINYHSFTSIANNVIAIVMHFWSEINFKSPFNGFIKAYRIDLHSKNINSTEKNTEKQTERRRFVFFFLRSIGYDDSEVMRSAIRIVNQVCKW